MTTGVAELLTQQELESFEEFAESATSWNVDFRQLDRERFRTSMLQARIGKMLFSHARLGCHVEQRGATPPGMRTFALTGSSSPEMHWFGHRVGEDVLLLFPRHREISAFSRPGLSVRTVSIPEVLLDGRFEQDDASRVSRMLGDDEMFFRAPRSLVRPLRSLMLAVPEIVRSASGNPVLVREFQDQLLSTLLAVIEGSSIGLLPARGRSGSTLRRALDFIHDHAETPLRVSDVLAVAGVSERSLQYLFRREIGLTPKRYLNGRRLYGVHRDLWCADRRQGRVADVASSWGFWHMGQFAADYRAMFGELPSDTLRRNHRDRRNAGTPQAPDFFTARFS